MGKGINRTQCRTCLYRAANTEHSNQTHNCEYILLVGHMRPSQPSPKCTVYERYDKKKRDELERRNQR